MNTVHKTTIMIIFLLTLACSTSAVTTATPTTPPPVVTVGADFVQVKAIPTPQTLTVCAEILNVRTGAGTRYTVIDHLFKGEAITVQGRSGGWVRIANTQWVNEKYLCEVKP